MICDKNEKRLNIGDRVHIECVVKEINESSNDCQLVVETVEPCHDGHGKSLFHVNARQVAKCDHEADEEVESKSKDLLEVTNIRAQTISLVNAQGQTCVSMTAMNNGGGIWLMRPNGDMIALFTLNEQMGFGIYTKESVTKGGGMPLSFSVYNGVPILQFKHKDDDVRIVELKDLVMAAEAIKMAAEEKAKQEVAPEVAP